jgi:cation transport ATPase
MPPFVVASGQSQRWTSRHCQDAGTRATVNGRAWPSEPRLFADTKTTIRRELDEVVGIWVSEGRTVLYVIRDGAVIGVLAVEDEIRPESAHAVKALHQLGGDDHWRFEAVAVSVARLVRSSGSGPKTRQLQWLAMA